MQMQRGFITDKLSDNTFSMLHNYYYELVYPVWLSPPFSELATKKKQGYDVSLVLPTLWGKFSCQN